MSTTGTAESASKLEQRNKTEGYHKENSLLNAPPILSHCETRISYQINYIMFHDHSWL